MALRAHLALLQAQRAQGREPPWPAPQAKAPPVKAPPVHAAPPSPQLDQPNQIAGAPPDEATPPRTTSAWDAALVEMFETTPEQQPPNLYEHLMNTAKNSILIMAMSHRLSEAQRQELRDIVSILRGIVFQ